MWCAEGGIPGRACIIIAVLISFLALPAYAADVLLSVSQPLSLGNNTTLVIEDVDTQQNVVWLNIYCDNRTANSAVMGLGWRLVCCGRNISLQRIYFGGSNDLVALNIENETGSLNATYGNAYGNASVSDITAAGSAWPLQANEIYNYKNITVNF
jgi:hypothetical protein